MVNKKELVCVECGKHPHEIMEYKFKGDINNMSPEEFVYQEDGTYNEEHNLFCCTKCYIKLGTPNGSELYWLYEDYKNKNK